jgi:hypothetical protein
MLHIGYVIVLLNAGMDIDDVNIPSLLFSLIFENKCGGPLDETRKTKVPCQAGVA